MWAFSRDGALPFSRFIYRLNPKTRTPIYAVCSSAFVALLAGLLAFGGSVAISSVFSASVVAQYIALSIPVLCRLLGSQTWVPGVFTLGKYVRLFLLVVWRVISDA